MLYSKENPHNPFVKQDQKKKFTKLERKKKIRKAWVIIIDERGNGTENRNPEKLISKCQSQSLKWHINWKNSGESNQEYTRK